MTNRRRSPFPTAGALALLAALGLLVAGAGCVSRRPPHDRWHNLLGPNHCVPRPAEDACWGCMRSQCCEQLYRCEGSAACICFFPCRFEFSRATCDFVCRVTEVPSYANDLATCANERCAMPCSERSW
jgi:hypothetical protein